MSFEPIRLVITGKPAPQGSKVPTIVKTKHGIRPGLREDPTTGWTMWRPRVHDQAAAAARCNCGDPDCLELRPGYPLNVPLQASMVFYFDRPQGHFKASTATRSAMTVLKPDAPLVPLGSVGDLEKLARAVCDGMQSGQLIADDKLICRYVRLERLFAGPHELLQQAGAIVWLFPYVPGPVDPRFPDQLATPAGPPAGGLLDLLSEVK